MKKNSADLKILIAKYNNIFMQNNEQNGFTNVENLSFQSINDFICDSMNIIRNDTELNIETSSGKLILCTRGQLSISDGSTCPNCETVTTKMINEIIEDQLSSNVSIH